MLINHDEFIDELCLYLSELTPIQYIKYCIFYRRLNKKYKYFSYDELTLKYTNSLSDKLNILNMQNEIIEYLQNITNK